MTDENLLTITEVAKRLRLKPSTIRGWILRRKLPYLKVGRLLRFRSSDVEAIIAASLVPAIPAETGKEVRL